MAGAQRRGSSECKAWAPQIRGLWERVGKDREWERPRAPVVRLLWDVRATEAVLEFLESTRVGCRTAARAIGPREEEGQASGGEEGLYSCPTEGGSPVVACRTLRVSNTASNRCTVASSPMGTSHYSTHRQTAKQSG